MCLSLVVSHKNILSNRTLPETPSFVNIWHNCLETFLTPALTRMLHPLQRLPGGGYLGELLAVTLAAQVATLPIVAVTFHVVSLVAPLANLLTVPLLGTLLVLGALLCAIGVLSPLLLQLCGELAWPLVHYVAVVISWCAHLSWSALNVGNVDTLLIWLYYALLGALYYLWYLWPLTQEQIINKAREASRQRGTLTRQRREVQQLPPRVRLLMAALILLTCSLALFQAQAQASTNQAEVTFFSLGSPAQPEAGTAIFLKSTDGHNSLIDGGLDSAGVGLALDRLLSPWQHTLDTVMLTAPLQDHITGLQDVAARYTIGRAVDAGMLHPSATYARWRRTISERAIPYVVAQQGSIIPSGANMQIQVLWPLELHKGSDEARDNSLVLRLTAPGLSLLLLEEAATSNYALQGLLDDIEPTYLQADIVQVVDNANKPFPQALATLLTKAQPAQLVVTPGAPGRGVNKQASSTSSEELSTLLSRETGGLLSTLTIRFIARTGTLTLCDTGQGWQSFTENDSFSSS
ncbi:ComEC/Rec2-related protein [Ktedonobacter racemifer DSM 44963]|uniref:ComEC/Rec2-related protein n=1 Tax=Ktedonobacter racemifer DSM 44963 TaxID=485913 RepID=D6TLJ4_KTERA|nr:ComEC/Rec2-related protein [Ktedonobacter racemifer DSM 44963]